MSTSDRIAPGKATAYVPTTALAKAVEFDEIMMHISFTDGVLYRSH